VLGDPARRAAYDRALAGERPPAARIPVRRTSSPGPAGGTTPLTPAGGTTPLARAAGPPLRAGPVRVEGGPGPVPRAGSRDQEDVRLALLAELALRYLARDQGRPW
jgi:hypothetical protein